MRNTIETLRKNAELNLCRECYNHYLAGIEPSIKKILVDTINDWRSAETYITRMVMKKKGVFKSNLEFLSIDNWDEKFADDVDVELFKKIKKRSFYHKILYLKNEKVIPQSCYEFLRRVKNIRNNIHEDPIVYRFTEKDLELFSIAHSISANLHSSTFSNWSEEIRNTMISRCEQDAKRYISNW